MFPEPIHPEALPGLVTLPIMLAMAGWCLVQCFLGAVIYRAKVVAAMALAAAAGGAYLVLRLRPEAAPVDFAVVAGGLALVGGLLGWFLWRLWLGLQAAVVALTAIGLGLFPFLGQAAWGAAAVVALVALVLAFRHAVFLAVSMSAVLGAFGTVYAVIGYCFFLPAEGQTSLPTELTQTQIHALLAGLPVAVVLAIVGSVVQRRILKHLAPAKPAETKKASAAKPAAA